MEVPTQKVLANLTALPPGFRNVPAIVVEIEIRVCQAARFDSKTILGRYIIAGQGQHPWDSICPNRAEGLPLRKQKQ